MRDKEIIWLIISLIIIVNLILVIHLIIKKWHIKNKIFHIEESEELNSTHIITSLIYQINLQAAAALHKIKEKTPEFKFDKMLKESHRVLYIKNYDSIKNKTFNDLQKEIGEFIFVTNNEVIHKLDKKINVYRTNELTIARKQLTTSNIRFVIKLKEFIAN